ncbi:MAG: DUF1015 domain-containing protein [Deltaproteobacteria bacterium]|jgi:uncharacterized protein (DUF1015 family)|nr:DUF1015 domain-containing protein [Deltaproteobacteria bacterium]
MVKIAPFKGVVYNKSRLESEGGLLLAPPYDVLTESQRQEYLDSHENNFLHLDLGRTLPEDQEALTWHERSASTLNAWLNSGVLVRREQPSIIMMDTEWAHPITGRRMTRHGFICLLCIGESANGGKVKLHEKTFSYHKEERLDLMKKTRCQLSPVFGFFPDPDDAILKTMYDLGGSVPDLTITERSGLSHQITFLQAQSSLGDLISRLASSTVYIADGHHRFETALKYRQIIREEMSKNDQEPPANSALDYVLIYLCPMSDPGLVVLPTHRVLSKLDLSNEEILKALEPFAEIKTFPWPKGGAEKAALLEMRKKLIRDDDKGLTVFGLYLKGAEAYYFLKLKEKVKHKIARSNSKEACLSCLDVSILTNVVFQEALGLSEADLDDPKTISYFSDIDETIEEVKNGEGRAAFILNHTSLEEILKVTEAGMVMPRKATYFYPKVSSGIVFNLVNPMESIQGMEPQS